MKKSGEARRGESRRATRLAVKARREEKKAREAAQAVARAEEARTRGKCPCCGQRHSSECLYLP